MIKLNNPKECLWRHQSFFFFLSKTPTPVHLRQKNKQKKKLRGAHRSSADTKQEATAV